MNRSLVIVLSCFLLASAILVAIDNSDVGFASYWSNIKSKNQTDRSPSNFITENLQLYQDYFDYETFNKSLDYQVKTKFYSNRNKKGIKKQAKKALHQALAQTFAELSVESKSGEPRPFISLLKKNLMSGVVNHFLKNLYILRIVNGAFQFNFEFNPVRDNKLDFASELNSNQLVQLGQKGNLYKYLISKEKNLVENILNTSIPKTSEIFQYVGGSINLWMKIADLAFSPDSLFPNPKKNGFKGLITYRRYFRVNKKSFDLSYENKNLFFNKIEVVAKDKEHPAYVTVDLEKSLNLSQIVPQNDRLVFKFGKLTHNNLKKAHILSKIFPRKEKQTKAGKFIINGKYIDQEKAIEIDIKVQLRKIVFDYKKMEFDRLASKMKINFSGTNISSQLKNKIIHEFKEFLFDRSFGLIVEDLALSSLFPTKEMKQ